MMTIPALQQRLSILNDLMTKTRKRRAAVAVREAEVQQELIDIRAIEGFLGDTIERTREELAWCELAEAQPELVVETRREPVEARRTPLNF